MARYGKLPPEGRWPLAGAIAAVLAGTYVFHVEGRWPLFGIVLLGMIAGFIVNVMTRKRSG